VKPALGLVLVAFACAASCVPQGPSAATAPTSVSSSENQPATAAPAVSVQPNDAHTVRLDVIVTDKSGTPIKGLNAGDFTVLDNKQRPAVSVEELDAPGQAGHSAVEAYILIDTINPQISSVASERHDLTEYLTHAGNLPIPTSLVFLSTEGLKIQGQSTRDPMILLANLESNPTSVRTFQNTGYFSAEALREKSFDGHERIGGQAGNETGPKTGDLGESGLGRVHLPEFAHVAQRPGGFVFV
jgi:hypothetical protein